MANSWASTKQYILVYSCSYIYIYIYIFIYMYISTQFVFLFTYMYTKKKGIFENVEQLASHSSTVIGYKCHLTRLMNYVQLFVNWHRMQNLFFEGYT